MVFDRAVSPESMPAVQMVSIAVLPFEDFSADSSQDYFGKGIAEELINALSQYADLKVAGRTSAFSFQGKELGIRDIGEQLNVAYILEGSIRKNEERIRVTAQLVRSNDGYHVWSETYDRDLTDIFSIQDEIVAQLSRTLEFHLGVGAGEGRAERASINPRAYEEYLKGLHYWAERDNIENRLKAYKTFKLVTEIAPDFADAWAAYASSIAKNTPDNFDMTLDKYLSEATKGFTTALELEPENTRALSGFAVFVSMHDLHIQRALELIEQAIALAPNAAYVHYNKHLIVTMLRDFEQAEAHITRAMTLDPLNCTYQRVRLQNLIYQGELEQIQQERGISEFCQHDKNAPLFIAGVKFIANLYLGSKQDAIKSLQELRHTMEGLEKERLDPRVLQGMQNFIESYAVLIELIHQNPEAIKAVNEGIEREGKAYYLLQYLSAESSILVYNALNLNDLLLNELQQAYNQRTLSFFETHAMPVFTQSHVQINETMRRDPRYREFWNQPGLREL